MLIIVIIGILILPDLLKASRTAQQTEQIRARQSEQAARLAVRQEERVHEAERKQAERNHQIEMKRSQASAQLEQLNTLRDQYIGLAADLEEQISLTWHPGKKSKLVDQQLKLEQRLYSLDTHIAKLWDVAYSH